MKNSRKAIIVFSVLALISSAVAMAAYYFSWELMDKPFNRTELIYSCEALSPVIFNFHEHMWGMPQFTINEFYQLIFECIQLTGLILFIFRVRGAYILQLGIYTIIGVVSIYHILYFAWPGWPPYYSQHFPWYYDIRFWYLVLIISRILWGLGAAVMVRQLVKYTSDKNR
jgi:hypothetical protein